MPGKQGGDLRLVSRGGPTTGRDRAVDSLRGLAVVLMVAGHVVGSTADRGLTVPDDSVWRFAYVLLDDVRMPLFTLLSGYVYALRPVTQGRYRQFLVGKARRLLVPMAVVGTVYLATQSVVPGVNAGPQAGAWWRIYLFPFEHLWFVQAILLIFLLAAGLERLGALSSPWRIALLAGLAAVAHLTVTVPAAYDVLSIGGAVRLLPFFLLGCLLARAVGVTGRAVSTAVTAAALGLLALQALSQLRWVDLPPGVQPALGLLLGATCVTALMCWRARLASGWLARLGRHSYEIYLLHVFGTAGTRVAAVALGVDSTPVLFVLALAAGLGLPVLFVQTLGRSRWVNRLVLGGGWGRPERVTTPDPAVPAARTPTPGGSWPPGPSSP